MAICNTLPSQPVMQSERVLFASDFDGTKFLTSETAAGILTVTDAYAEGIRDSLGICAVDQFLAQGGHQHRTPAEIIADLCADADVREIESLSTRLIAAKIAILTEQIGKKLSDGALWPRPTEGFVSLWEGLDRYAPLGVGMTTADVSAGHVPFIHQTYDTHGLKRPDLVITDDLLVDEFDLGDVSPEERAKPSTLLLEVTSALWIAELGLAQSTVDTESFKENTLYIGDSLEKDGGMARNYGVDFILLHSEAAAPDWREVEDWIEAKTVMAREVAS